MAVVAEPAFLSEQAKKEIKDRTRAETKALEKEKKLKEAAEKEKEDRQQKLRLIEENRNNGQNHKQLPRITGASAKPPQYQPLKALVKPALTSLPVASAMTTVPTSTTHPAPVACTNGVPKSTTDASKKMDSNQESQTRSVAPAKAVVSSPIATGKSVNDASDKMSNINHKYQQPAAIGSTNMTFYVGQIAISINTLIGRKETPAATIVGKTQATSVVVTYASALHNKPAEAQKNLGSYIAAAATSVSMTTPVSPVTTTVLVPAKEKVVAPAAKPNGQNGPMSSTTTSVSTERSYNAGTQRNNNGPNQKTYGSGKVTIGGVNGSGQSYNGNAYGNGPDHKTYGNVKVINGGANGSGQRYNGNTYGQRYYPNRRHTNESQNQKKQAKPKPFVDAEGWQVVHNRKRVNRDSRETER